MPPATVEGHARAAFDSRPVANAAASGNRRTDTNADHRHGRSVRGASLRAAGSCARLEHQDRARRVETPDAAPDRPRRAKENLLNNLNSILLEGNLTRDPELRYTPAGTPVCSLVVASCRTYKLNGERTEEVSFIEATTWGKLAEVCAEHLTKSRGVRVVGRIKQERWEDADGNARSKVVIVAEHVEFQPRRAQPQPAAVEARQAS